MMHKCDEQHPACRLYLATKCMMQSQVPDLMCCQPLCTFLGRAQVTEQIRQRTGHLPGVAIAIMGCIVNGPGEMADADFG